MQQKQAAGEGRQCRAESQPLKHPTSIASNPLPTPTLAPNSALASPIGNPPRPPELNEFQLSDNDLKKRPRLWFRPNHVTGKMDFYPLVVLYALCFLLAFGDKIHSLFDVVAGFFFFTIVSLIPYFILISILGAIETKIYSIIDKRFAMYCRYEKALSAFHRKDAEYKARIERPLAQFWKSLSGVSFEKELGALFMRGGYAVKFTPHTGDGGIDLVLQKDGKITVVQCKAHNKRIPINVARELVASMMDAGADNAIIACFEGVTQPVADYIKNKRITVLTVNDIVEYEREYHLKLIQSARQGMRGDEACAVFTVVNEREELSRRLSSPRNLARKQIT